MSAERNKLKNWQKVAIGIATIGVTGTLIYFGVKKIKAHIAANKKKAAETDAKKEKDAAVKTAIKTIVLPAPEKIGKDVI